MKRILLTSLTVAASVAAVRLFELLRHPEWSAPILLPVLIAFVGSFLGSFAVLAVLRLVRSRLR